MARKLKKSKVSNCVFCEGESEQVYTVFLRDCTTDIAHHQIHKAAYKSMRCLSSKRHFYWLAKNIKQNR